MKTVKDVDVKYYRKPGMDGYSKHATETHVFDYNLDGDDLHLIKILLEEKVDKGVKSHNEYCMKRYNKLRKVPYNTGLGRYITALDKVKQTIQLLEIN
tara:strand:+ start:195 stop:488 length:294 start_codon:yes stop_codon:yes gene_type:complete